MVLSFLRSRGKTKALDAPSTVNLKGKSNTEMLAYETVSLFSGLLIAPHTGWYCRSVLWGGRTCLLDFSLL